MIRFHRAGLRAPPLKWSMPPVLRPLRPATSTIMDTCQMLRWFRAFLPREERFFELFARHSQTVVQGALALQGMLRGGDETPVFCQRVNQFENDADNITREVLTAVRRTFITPFDRGDIKNLITSMDDAIDQMQQTAKAVVLFEVRAFEPPMREMGQ